MSLLKRSILTITEPTIKVLPFDIHDIESDTDNTNNYDKLSKEYGGEYPAIRINEYDFYKNDILAFHLSLNGFLPKLSVTIADSRGVFDLSQYPKDGDVVQLYIRSKDEKIYKPIRMDFDIIAVDGKPMTNVNREARLSLPSKAINLNQVFSFECRAKIPGLYAETNIGYSKDTSFNHLEKMATELKLGFASNITNTKDEMPRFCAYDTRLKFIQDYTNSAYLDDNSFFTSFIDLYYYLNFVEVNRQFIIDKELEDAIISLNDELTKEKESKDVSAFNGKLFLTNLEDGFAGTSRYIRSFTLVNKAGLINLKNGYNRVIQYYDVDDRQYRSFKIQPLITENLPDDLYPLRGKNNEDFYKTYIKYKYLGKQSSIDNYGNTHLNYYYAQINNYQNNQDIYKLSLLVELDSPNLALYRYQQIPVIIYETSLLRANILEDREKKAEKEENYKRFDDNELNEADNKSDNIYNKPKLNKFLTGIYVIGEIEYFYRANSENITQRLLLLRREWPQVI